MNKPNVSQEESLESLNAQVHEGLESGARAIIQVGLALEAIRQHKGYPGTFEDYVDREFDLNRIRAYQLIYAAEVMQDLVEAFPSKSLPRSESAMRPLVKLSKAQRIKVWERVLSERPNKRMPGYATVKAAVEAMNA